MFQLHKTEEARAWARELLNVLGGDAAQWSPKAQAALKTGQSQMRILLSEMDGKAPGIKRETTASMGHVASRPSGEQPPIDVAHQTPPPRHAHMRPLTLPILAETIHLLFAQKQLL